MRQLAFAMGLCSLAMCLHNPAFGQKDYNLPGVYSNESVTLEVRADGTFTLAERDFTGLSRDSVFTTKGVWKHNYKNKITLNPELKKRKPELKVIERWVMGIDSVRARIHFRLQQYRNESLVSDTAFVPKHLTILLNDTDNFVSAVREPLDSSFCDCKLALQRQQVVSDEAIVSFAPTRVRWIWIWMFRWQNMLKQVVFHKKSNFFDITIRYPIDVERTRRSKEVRIEPEGAYFYEGKRDRILKGKWVLKRRIPPVPSQ